MQKYKMKLNTSSKENIVAIEYKVIDKEISIK